MLLTNIQFDLDLEQMVLEMDSDKLQRLKLCIEKREQEISQSNSYRLTEKELDLMKVGRVIDTIRSYRKRTGLGTRESHLAVNRLFSYAVWDEAQEKV